VSQFLSLATCVKLVILKVNKGKGEGHVINTPYFPFYGPLCSSIPTHYFFKATTAFPILKSSGSHTVVEMPETIAYKMRQKLPAKEPL